MNEKQPLKPIKREHLLAEKIGLKAKRKIRAKRHQSHDVWFGLGMMGLIGWSIAIPTLVGIAIGIWLDQNYPGNYSWTLALLVGGLALGCWNAGYWVVKEEQNIRNEQDDDNE